MPPRVLDYTPSALPLVGKHLRKLRRSGLTDETIRAAQIYTEDSSASLVEILRGRTEYPTPALVFPGFDADGDNSDYDTVRFHPPLSYADGKPAKYLQPTGRTYQAYFPPLDAMREAVSNPSAPILLTEGILKALASTQAGVPTIHVGTTTWCVKDSEPKELVPNLRRFHWYGRPVLIVFDTDRKRKPSVNWGASALAEALRREGAQVRICWLPRSNGTKNAIDDFIVEFGEEVYRGWVAEQLGETSEIDIDAYRRAMVENRLGTVGESGIFVDRSPTGSGKSTADSRVVDSIGAAKGRTAIFVPSWPLVHETATGLTGMGGNTLIPLPRLDSSNCYKPTEVEGARSQGLDFSEAVCSECQHSKRCTYKGARQAALASSHIVCTQAFGGLSMAGLAADRNWISIHEDGLDLFRPTLKVRTGLIPVKTLAEQTLKVLNWAEKLSPLKKFFTKLGEVAEHLHGWLEGSNWDETIPLPEPVKVLPESPEAILWRVIRDYDIKQNPEAFRLCMEVTLGNVEELSIQVRPNHIQKDGEPPKMIRTLIGVSRLEIPDIPIVLSDATACPRTLSEALGRPVTEITPRGRLRRNFDVVQIPSDVKLTTEPSTAISILRGILHDSGLSRVGLITHSKFVEPLQEAFPDRIARATYFGSGESRGSNSFIDGNCDGLVVLGTPRVPTEAIAEVLLKWGRTDALRLSEEDREYVKDWWSADTVSGKKRVIQTQNYTDWDWYEAFRAKTVAELQQCIGRARPILPNGLPVYVVTNVEIGEKTCDEGQYEPITESQKRVLELMRRGKVRRTVRTPELAVELGISERGVRKTLRELQEAGRVRKIGARRNARWLLVR